LEALGNSGVDSIEELKDEDKEALKKA